MPSLIAILGLDGSRFSAGLDKAKHEAQHAGGHIASSLGEGIKGAIHTWAGMEGVHKVFEEMEKQGEQAHAAALGGLRLGVGAAEYLQLEKAASKYGASIGDVTTAFKKLAMGSVEAQGGNAELIASFGTLGVSMSDLKGKKVDEIFELIAHNLKGGEMSAERLTALIKTMGKGADELIPAFKEGAFSKQNPFVDEEGTLHAAEKFHKDMSVISGAMKRVWRDMFSPEANQNITGGVHWLADKVRGFFGLTKEPVTAPPVDLKTVTKAQIEAEQAKQKESAKLAKEREGLEERLHDIRQRNALDTLSKEEQINELHRRRVELAQFVIQNWDKLSAENRLKAQIDLEQMMGDEARLQRGAEKPKAAKRDVNELQKIGAYIGGPDLLVDLNRKSEDHLRNIRTDIRTLVTRSQNSGGTQY